MNAKQVIEELSKYPGFLPVRGFMTCVITGDAEGEFEITPEEAEAQEVTDVKYRGLDIVLECGGIAA